MIGQVDDKSFVKSFEKIFSDKVIQLEQAAVLVSKWQEEVYNAAWYPFKFVGTGDGMKAFYVTCSIHIISQYSFCTCLFLVIGNMWVILQEIVDDEDEKLKNLSEEFGEDVKNSVKIALKELNEFNPSGRYAVPTLWNFAHGREATLKEGIKWYVQYQTSQTQTNLNGMYNIFCKLFC